MRITVASTFIAVDEMTRSSHSHAGRRRCDERANGICILGSGRRSGEADCGGVMDKLVEIHISRLSVNRDKARSDEDLCLFLGAAWLFMGGAWVARCSNCT